MKRTNPYYVDAMSLRDTAAEVLKALRADDIRAAELHADALSNRARMLADDIATGRETAARLADKLRGSRSRPNVDSAADVAAAVRATDEAREEGCL